MVALDEVMLIATPVWRGWAHEGADSVRLGLLTIRRSSLVAQTTLAAAPLAATPLVRSAGARLALPASRL